MNPKLEISSLPYLEGDWRYLYLIKVKFHANLHLFYSYRTLAPINSGSLGLRVTITNFSR